jgi:hypothetical protein
MMGNKNQFANMTDEERAKALVELPDEEIDYSDIPELGDDFFASAQFVNKQTRGSKRLAKRTVRLECLKQIFEALIKKRTHSR